jgi:hypothetical protein
LQSLKKSIDIPEQDDAFNEIRDEYRSMLKNQLSKGNNGLVKTKYITFGVEAESLKIARPRLDRIEADVLNNFKVLGAQAHTVKWGRTSGSDVSHFQSGSKSTRLFSIMRCQ